MGFDISNIIYREWSLHKTTIDFAKESLLMTYMNIIRKIIYKMANITIDNEISRKW